MTSTTQEDLTDLWSSPAGRSAHLDGDAERRYAEIPLDRISPNPHQPRHEIDLQGESFRELVESIRTQGILQPILVWQPDIADERYVLVAGERRWRACKALCSPRDSHPRPVESAPEPPRFTGDPAAGEAGSPTAIPWGTPGGLPSEPDGSPGTPASPDVGEVQNSLDSEVDVVPAIVIRMDGQPEANLLGKALSENVVRSNLSTAETAQAAARLRELTGWTWETIAERLGLAVNRVQDLAAVARHEPVRLAVADGSITQRQAVAIAQGTADADEAADLVTQARGRDLAATRRLVAQRRRPKGDLSVPVDPVITPPPMVDVDALPIAKLVGRGRLPRAEVEKALAASCAVLGYWPARP